MTVFEMTFLSKEYKQPSKVHQAELDGYYQQILAAGETPVIVDCGANIGMSPLWFAQSYPRAEILAIEPEPGNYEILASNTSSFPNIHPLRAGISSEQGWIRVVNPGDSSWGFRTVKDDAGDTALITIGDAVAKVPNGRILLVKVDIEGFETSLFASNLDWIDQTPMIVVETHDWMHPWHKTAQIINRAIFSTGDWDQLQHGENLFFYSHKFLKPNQVSV